MTEENKDSNLPKLRLSRITKKSETEPGTENECVKTSPSEELSPREGVSPGKAVSPSKEDSTNKEASTPKPNLKLKRPDANSAGGIQNSEPSDSAVTNPDPDIKFQVDNQPEAKPQTTQEPPTVNPENFSEGFVDDESSIKRSQKPPKLPDNPSPVHVDPPTQEEKPDTSTEEDTKHRGLFVSIFVIVLLLALLGGSGYGLYYLLMPLSETSDEVTTTEQTSPDPHEETAEPQHNKTSLSQPIAKAKAVVAEIQEQDPETAWQESEAEAVPPAPVVNDTLSGIEPESVQAKPQALAPQMDNTQKTSVSEFLKKAHIGGMRTGDRPKLILNGKSYDQGDLIDPTTGLRFIGFRDKRLAFQDGQGIVYLKSF